MNDLIIAPAPVLDLPEPSPLLSRALEAAAQQLVEWRPTRTIAVRTPELRAEAERRAAALETLLAPAGEAKAKLWCVSLGNLVAKPPADLEIVANLYASLMADWPEACFTRETLAAVAMRKFWPAYADIVEVLRPIVGPTRREVAALRLIAEAPAPRPQEPKVDPARVRQTVVSFKEAMAERARAREAAEAREQSAERAADRARIQAANERNTEAALRARAAQGDRAAAERLARREAAQVRQSVKEGA